MLLAPVTHIIINRMEEELTRLRAKRDRLENSLDAIDDTMSEAKEMLLRQQLVAVENQIAALLASMTISQRLPVQGATTSSSLAPGPTAAVVSSDACPWQLMDCFGPSAQGENTTPLQHLSTILKNILQFPTQEKYQSLRLMNDRLQRELFHVRLGDAAMLVKQLPTEQQPESAAEAFLVGVGFRRELRPLPTTSAATGSSSARGASLGEAEPTSEPWLVFSLAAPTSPSSESHARLTSALQVIEDIRKRDADTQRHVAEFQSLRKSVVMNIRMDRLRQAVDAGEAESFCELLMLGDASAQLTTAPTNREGALAHEEEELSATLDNVQTIRRVLQNIADAPHDERFRKLRLGNRLVHRSLTAQRGGLEFIIGVAGFTLRDDGDVVLEGPAKDKAVNALGCLDRIERAVVAKHDKVQREARASAMEYARAEVEAEVEKTRAAKRQKAALADLAERRAGGGSGVRVRLEDAVKHLLGVQDE